MVRWRGTSQIDAGEAFLVWCCFLMFCHTSNPHHNFVTSASFVGSFCGHRKATGRTNIALTPSYAQYKQKFSLFARRKKSKPDKKRIDVDAILENDDDDDSAEDSIEVEQYGRRFLVRDPDTFHHANVNEESSPKVLDLDVKPSMDVDGPFNLDSEQDSDFEYDVFVDEQNKENEQKHVDDDTLIEMLLTTNTTVPSMDPVPVYNITLDNLELLTESSNLAYFYLKNELGMSEEAMWKITYETGSVLGMTAHALRHKVDLLRRSMNLSDEDVCTIIERHPAILTKSADKNLAPKILFFVRALDLSKEELRGIVIQYPSILSYAMSNLKSKLNLFSKLMGYTNAEMRTLFISEPKLLAAGVETGLVPRMQFLLREMKIPLENLRIIVQKNPRLLLYSLDDNLRPKLIFFFIMTLHMEPTQLTKVLLKYPQVVDYNLECTISPITRYFVAELEFSHVEVRNIVLKFPRLFSNSLAKIKHVVGYFRYELGMEAAQVKRVLYQAPQALSINTDVTLKSKVEFLRDSLSLSNVELIKVLSGMPTLILCGIDSNLKPKVEYLLEAFENNKDQLRKAVTTLPTLLGYSLDKRLRPRMEQLKDSGGHPSGITIGIPMREDKFQTWLQNRAARLRASPGFDDPRMNYQKEARSIHSTDKSSSLIEKEVPPSKEERSGRVVHWSRTPQIPDQ